MAPSTTGTTIHIVVTGTLSGAANRIPNESPVSASWFGSFRYASSGVWGPPLPWFPHIGRNAESNWPIPNSFSKLKKLRSLKLNSNNLSGPIPTFLGRLKRLEEVDLSNNKLSGVIPASLATLPSLSQLNVSSNQLCGAIATGLKKFEKSMFEHNKCLCGAPLAACKWGLPASI